MGREAGRICTAQDGHTTRLSRWHSYPAMVPDELAVDMAAQIVNPGNRVLDPFCGSGRLLFAAASFGARCVGLDVNPLACLITEAKAAQASAEAIHELAIQCPSAQRSAPRTKGVKLRNTSIPWFSDVVGSELAQIISWINSLGLARPEMLVVAVALSAATREASWIKKTGWKLHRMTASERELRTSSAWQSFQRRLQHYASAVMHEPAPAAVEVHRIRSDDATPDIFGQFDAILTSPPYGDSRTTVQYGAASSICLDVVSHLDGFPEIYSPGRHIDGACLGGRGSSECRKDIKRFWAGAQSGEGFKRVSRFLDDFATTCGSLTKLLNDNGKIAMVVGRRSVGGYRVKFDDFAIAEMEKLGFRASQIERRRLQQKSLPRAINRFARASSAELREKGRTNTMGEEIILTFDKG